MTNEEKRIRDNMDYDNLVDELAKHVGRLVAHIIITRVENTIKEYEEMKVKVLGFRERLDGKLLIDYDTHFDVEVVEKKKKKRCN